MACTGEWDLVCCGHSHAAGVDQVANVRGGRTWLVNPGRWRGSRRPRPGRSATLPRCALKFFLWPHSPFLSFAAPSPLQLRDEERCSNVHQQSVCRAFGVYTAAVTQAYVVVMIILVAAGTLFDVVHKGSAKYFFENWRKSKSKGSKQVGGGELVSIAIKTGVVDVLASGEFCNARRRIAHLFTMYGFVIYVVTTAIMIFSYPTPRRRRPPSCRSSGGSAD